MRNDFAIFICTHGRPNKQLTLDALMKVGYSGKWFLVVDDTDKTIQEYIDNYGADRVIIFNKNHYINSEEYDNCDNQLHEKCILYAKRAVEDIAKSFGMQYFVIVDDDMTKFSVRYPFGKVLKRVPITDFDALLEAYIEVLNKPIAAIGFGHVTTYCSGVKAFSDENMSKRYLPYQFILRNGAIPVKWTSWFAEDDITELQSGAVGNMWIVIPYIMQDTVPIGDTTASGGMVETYKNSNMYRLNFNTVRCCPQRIYMTCKGPNRFVLTRYYDRCFPKLISGRFKK